jgi:uncharacterized membrane protein
VNPDRGLVCINGTLQGNPEPRCAPFRSGVVANETVFHLIVDHSIITLIVNNVSAITASVAPSSAQAGGVALHGVQSESARTSEVAGVIASSVDIWTLADANNQPDPGMVVPPYGDRDDNEQCTWSVVASIMWYRPHYRFLMSTLVFFTIYFAWFGNASSYFQVERASKACILAQLSWCIVISAMPLTLQPILSHHSDGGNPRYAIILGATQMVAFTMMGAIVAKLAPCGETIAVDGAKHATFRMVAIQSNVLLGCATQYY